MAKEQVGASIVEIITESLYDKPIVIFKIAQIRLRLQGKMNSLAICKFRYGKNRAISIS